MLETFVPSRIRRALLEHLLAHPESRFYLRGLAKELTLPISPLRRELLRLEQLGVLKAAQEANIRFYTVNQTSQDFMNLKPALLAEPAPLPAPLLPAASPVPAAEARPALSLAAAVPPLHHEQLQQQQIERIQRALKRAPAWPKRLALGVLMVGVGMVVGVVTLMSVAPGGKETVVAWLFPGLSRVQTPASVGEMHSHRWRLAPSTMEGFAGPGLEGNH